MTFLTSFSRVFLAKKTDIDTIVLCIFKSFSRVLLAKKTDIDTIALCIFKSFSRVFLAEALTIDTIALCVFKSSAYRRVGRRTNSVDKMAASNNSCLHISTITSTVP